MHSVLIFLIAFPNGKKSLTVTLLAVSYNVVVLTTDTIAVLVLVHHKLPALACLSSLSLSDYPAELVLPFQNSGRT
jgi:hypothetical protein